MWRRFRHALAVLAAVAASGGVAAAAETTLIFATANPATAHIDTKILRPWVDAINADGKGIVHVDMRQGMALANLGNSYDRVLNDVVQISWAHPGFVRGKFPLSDVLSLPFVTGSAEAGSVAFWRLYKSGLLDHEYDQVVPLVFFQMGQTGVQFVKPPASVDDLNGLKVIVNNKNQADMSNRLGATASSISLQDAYEALQRGAADAIMVGWTAVPPFKLAEVTRYHLEASLGGTLAMLFMSKKKWDSLSEDARRILMKNSGEAESRKAGQFWDAEITATRDAVKAQPGHTAATLTLAQAAAWKTKLGPVVDSWVTANADADKVLATFRKILADVEAGH